MAPRLRHFTDASGQSTRHPTADPRRGDNLTSYVSAIESFLARGCKLMNAAISAYDFEQLRLQLFATAPAESAALLAAEPGGDMLFAPVKIAPQDA